MATEPRPEPRTAAPASQRGSTLILIAFALALVGIVAATITFLPRGDRPSALSVVGGPFRLDSSKGGTVDSPLPPAVWRNVTIDNAHRVEVDGVTLTGGHTGVVVTRGSSDVILRNNIATDLQSDGFNVATATRVDLIGNTCRDFRPVPPVYEGARMVKDGTHPDCIMLWSEAGKPPTSDIRIIGNKAQGAMQGIAHFWHPNLGRDKVYRVTARNNIVDISYYHGIMLEDTPGSIVEGNVVTTTKGATAAGRPGVADKAWLKSDADAVRCGNRVDGKPERRCPPVKESGRSR